MVLRGAPSQIQDSCGGAAAARHRSVLFFVNVVGIHKDLIVVFEHDCNFFFILDLSMRILLNIVSSFIAKK
jgi:hypothetical protein